MKLRNIIMLSFINVILLIIVSCDNNDDAQTTPATPTDGFTINNTFYPTVNAYISIPQFDRDNNGQTDYYTFLFTDSRITTTYGEVGVGNIYSYSTNITTLVKLQIFEGVSNPNLTNTLTVGDTYIASSVLTTAINGYGIGNAGFNKDSFVSYNLQSGSTVFGNENGFDFASNPSEIIGAWHYAGTVGPTITINAINIDTVTPANSTIDVDYTFINTFGDNITGHYEGTLGILKG